MADIKIDQGAIEQLYSDIARDIEAALTRVIEQNDGKPVAEVVPAVDAAFRSVGVTGLDPLPFAEAISKGEKLPPITLQ